MHPSACFGLQWLVPVAHFKWDKGPRNFLLQAKACLDAFTFHFLFTGRTFWSLFPQDLTFSFSGICRTLKRVSGPTIPVQAFCSSSWQTNNSLWPTAHPYPKTLKAPNVPSWQTPEKHCFLFPDNSQHCWFIILMAPIRGCEVGNTRVLGVGGKHSLHVRLWVVMVSASTFLDVYLVLSELSVNASCCYCPQARLTPLLPRSPIRSVKGF